MTETQLMGLIDKSEHDLGGDLPRKRRCDTGVVDDESVEKRGS